ncbi:hypothetical protein [Agaribacterium haliotis]|uniref:hypothetical protein n=1 Tax=Agaribacterium haliotis TaxID=2013869 RepID=UPI001EFEDC1B|nr:hypothetical protein [Agaribacterium haliotis]
MKTLSITLLAVFIFAFNMSAFAADDHGHKYEHSEKHKERYAEGDYAQHDDHIDHKGQGSEHHDDHDYVHDKKEETKGDI